MPIEVKNFIEEKTMNEKKELETKRLNYLIDEAEKLNPSETKVKNDWSIHEKSVSLDTELTEKDIKEWIKKVSMSFYTTNIYDGTTPDESIESRRIVIEKFNTNGEKVSRMHLTNRNFNDSVNNNVRNTTDNLYAGQNGWTIRTDTKEENWEWKYTERKSDTLPKDLLDGIAKRVLYTKQKRIEREVSIAQNNSENEQKSADEELENNLNNMA